jgi:hypothetical protein
VGGQVLAAPLPAMDDAMNGSLEGRAIARRLGMKGYWICGERGGSLQVSFTRPTFWQRVWAHLFQDKSWVDYQ